MPSRKKSVISERKTEESVRVPKYPYDKVIRNEKEVQTHDHYDDTDIDLEKSSYVKALHLLTLAHSNTMHIN